MEGLPYIIVRNITSAFFTDMGVKESYLGYLNFLGIPWNLKFLWAPFLDIFGTKRGWMIKIQALISILMFGIALLAGIASKEPSSGILQIIAFAFVAMAFLSATNDIAIDAYYLEGLTTREDQAAYAGVRVLAYRIAIIFARTVLLGVVGIANWFYGFGVGAVTIFIFLLLHKFLLPRFEAERGERTITVGGVAKDFLASFLSYLKQERVILVLFFIATYKMGDDIIFSMYTPFLKRQLGVSNGQLAWLAGFIGTFAAIFGTMLGAWWIKKVSLKKAIWPITLFMNVNILAYVLLAYMNPSAADTNGIALIAAIHGYENFAAGLGNATLIIYLMRLCSPKYKAGHFAIGTAIMSLSATFIGGFAGVIVEHIGYVNFYIIGFLATIPSLIMLFWLPLHEGK